MCRECNDYTNTQAYNQARSQSNFFSILLTKKSEIHERSMIFFATTRIFQDLQKRK